MVKTHNHRWIWHPFSNELSAYHHTRKTSLLKTNSKQQIRVNSDGVLYHEDKMTGNAQISLVAHWWCAWIAKQMNKIFC